MLRELKPDEVRLCIEGGHSFFDEGKMPNGFDPEYFCRRWGDMIKDGYATILAWFEGDVICGALGAIVCPNLFSPVKVAVEGFWYVLPEHRNSKIGLRLLDGFEKWAASNGAQSASMIHLLALQPERIGEVYRRRGYTHVESSYMKPLEEEESVCH